MKKFIPISLFCVITSLIFSYAVLAFVAFETSPAKWAAEYRAMGCVIFFFTISIIGLLCSNLITGFPKFEKDQY